MSQLSSESFECSRVSSGTQASVLASSCIDMIAKRVQKSFSTMSCRMLPSENLKGMQACCILCFAMLASIEPSALPSMSWNAATAVASIQVAQESRPCVCRICEVEMLPTCTS
eukprot:762433-Hanusia_phi.AAC.9